MAQFYIPTTTAVFALLAFQHNKHLCLYNLVRFTRANFINISASHRDHYILVNSS